jgi:signal transduction histidine kinase
VIKLDIPKINDRPADFDKLFKLWNEAKGNSLDITFDFSTCDFLRPNAIAFLGGLARLVESRNGRVTFDWNTANDKILAILRQNRFARVFGYTGVSGGPGNSIPYREDKTQSIYASDVKDDIIEYLRHEWLGSGWVRMSPKLKNAIVGRVWEIYANAFLHAESGIGVFSCGQFFWRMGLLKLAVVDFGVGIPARIKELFKDYPSVGKLAAAACLRWAFQPGTSTRRHEGTGRGIGLDMLKEFVYVNHGKLEIYSENGYALITNQKEQYSNQASFFKGTVVNITLHCDERYYRFVNEGPSGPWF